MWWSWWCWSLQYLFQHSIYWTAVFVLKVYLCHHIICCPVVFVSPLYLCHHSLCELFSSFHHFILCHHVICGSIFIPLLYLCCTYIFDTIVFAALLLLCSNCFVLDTITICHRQKNCKIFWSKNIPILCWGGTLVSIERSLSLLLMNSLKQKHKCVYESSVFLHITNLRIHRYLQRVYLRIQKFP